ncbi:MAG: hypothetical protein DLM55_07230 [Acidimicrobiales bacterium]|nr:MAG: hypothetical protein DLM55_07230 [Acidimicrobiales bacterium]
MTIGVGVVAGQVLGGELFDVNLLGLGWRVVFLVNVPIGIVTLALAQHLLPESRASVRPGLDPVDVIDVSGSLALALVPLVLGRTRGWGAWT